MKRGRITKKKTSARKAKKPEVLMRVSPVRSKAPIFTYTEHTPRKWSLSARVVATVLVLFFVLVPVGDAYADTSETIQDSAPTITTAEIVTESAPEVVEEPIEPATVEEGVSEPVVEPVITSEEVQNEVVPEEVPVVNNATTSEASDTSLETSSDSSGSTGEDNSASTTPDIELPGDITDESGTTTDSVVEEVSTTTPPVDEVIEPVPTETIPVATTTATTSESIATTTDGAPEVLTHTTDADKFTFGVTECVALGNGAFQCVRGGDTDSTTAAHGPLYAAKDASGDMEIYLSNDSGSRPITANDYDDDAPSQDPVRGDIVWHAQIDDRSQVMHYNRETGATTRITKEAYNSMQPSIYDGDIVFQAWIGNDWEIVLVDHAEGREILTDNEQHDITPSITKDYIMWQAFEGEEWVGKVYDRSTKEIETVRGMDGGKVENPRMIMVFDSTHDNGDIDTLGYDPVSGEVVSLAVTPVPQTPERIPEPEPEQEEKAMVQPSVSTRTETKNASSTDSEAQGNTPVEPTVPNTASSTTAVATTSDDGVPTIDLSLDEPEEIAPSAPVFPDLVIPAFSSTNDEATTTPHS